MPMTSVWRSVVIALVRRCVIPIVLVLVWGVTLGAGIAARGTPAAAAPGLIPVGQSAITYGALYPGAGPTAAFSSPAVGNVTGDSAPEIVVGGMDGCVRVLSLNASVLRSCLSVGAAAVQSSPTLVDWDGDGTRDIIVASVGGGIYGWRGDGTPLFNFATHGGVFSTPAVGDIDGDGQLDLAVATWGQHITAYRHNGSQIFSRFIYDTSWSSPALADLDDNGQLEVIVGGDMDIGNAANLPPYNLAPGGLLWVLRADGSNAPGFPRHLSDQVVWSSPAVVDLDGNGYLDIVIGTGENWPNKGHALFAVDRTGNALPGWPVTTAGPTMGSPAIADLDNDGRLDVVQQSGDGTIAYIARDGVVWKQWCNRSFGTCQPLGMDGGPSVGDLDGDEVQEVVALTEAHLRVFSGRTGALETENSLPYTWAPGSHPTIVRHAGETYVVVSATVDANRVNGRDAGDQLVTSVFRTGHASGSLAWPMFRNNLKRTGTYDDSVPPTVSGSFTAAAPGFTKLKVEYAATDGETGIAGTDIDVRQDSLPWVRMVSRGAPRGAPGATVTGNQDVFALPGHDYAARVRTWDRAGNRSAYISLGTVAVSESDQRSQPFRAAYAGSVNGGISAISSPPVKGPSLPGRLGRGIAASPLGGGYALDGYGGLHPFGGAPSLRASAYWSGWDIARGVALDPAGGGGLVLDGFGGLHTFGSTLRPSNGPYWPGWDIARGVVLASDSTPIRPKGYVLDAFGGVHSFGGAPGVGTSGYWPGWPIVRGFALDPAGRGGYVLDAFGGMHPFGGAPRRSITGYWPGQDIGRGIALISGGAPGRGYVLDAAGAIWPFGGAPGVQATTYWGVLVARGLSIAP